MILLRRLNNSVLGLNADLIERIDATPDTVITLVDGKKYVVAETPEEVVERIVVFRANVLAKVGPTEDGAAPVISRNAEVAPLRLVASVSTDESPIDAARDAASNAASGQPSRPKEI
jgi:flagellar protein FlbD